MICGKPAVCFCLQVKRGCRFTKMKPGCILFIKVLVLIDLFCRPAGAKYHESACKRIKSAGMTDFQLFDPECTSYHYPDLVHQVKGCPVKRLVKQQNLPFFKNTFLFSFHITPAKLPVIQLLHNILKTISACCALPEISSTCRQGNPNQ